MSEWRFLTGQIQAVCIRPAGKRQALVHVPCYGDETKRFNEAVKRNLAKFPADLMFTRSAEEFSASRSQFATSNNLPAGRSGRRYAPRVFTEQGALMAATILNSPRVVDVSI